MKKKNNALNFNFKIRTANLGEVKLRDEQPILLSF